MGRKQESLVFRLAALCPQSYRTQTERVSHLSTKLWITSSIIAATNSDAFFERTERILK